MGGFPHNLIPFTRTPAECLDAALNALARALEINRANPEIWCHYLNLFSKRGTKEEVQEMCETAVQYASTHAVWWTVSINWNLKYCRYSFINTVNNLLGGGGRGAQLGVQHFEEDRGGSGEELLMFGAILHRSCSSAGCSSVTIVISLVTGKSIFISLACWEHTCCLFWTLVC